MPHPTAQYGQIVVVALAPFIRFSLSRASAVPGAITAIVPATAVPPEYFKKSRLEIPILHLHEFVRNRALVKKVKVELHVEVYFFFQTDYQVWKRYQGLVQKRNKNVK
jgi:hypothetical protein